jgi:hypothetical protein
MSNKNAKNFFAALGMVFTLLVMVGPCAILAGCNRETPTPRKVGFVNLGGPSEINYNEVTIEGCEYIHYDRSLTHKGNCTNSVHKYQVENR